MGPGIEPGQYTGEFKKFKSKHYISPVEYRHGYGKLIWKQNEKPMSTSASEGHKVLLAGRRENSYAGEFKKHKTQGLILTLSS